LVHNSRLTLLIFASVLLVGLPSVVAPLTVGSYSLQAQSNSQSSGGILELSMAGGVLSAGNQQYFTSGGALFFAKVNGEILNSSSARISYETHASVVGLSVRGDSELQISGTTLGDKKQVSVTIHTSLFNMTPIMEFPLGCQTNCTSAIPAMFLGAGKIQGEDGVGRFGSEIVMAFESPYLNPWGGPILMASQDNSTVIVTSYTKSIVDWKGVELGGIVMGEYKGERNVFGEFGMVVNSRENLLLGVEFDRGSISFFGMNRKNFDASGSFHGVSIIPTEGAFSCAEELHLPPGTCTATGLNSTGSLELQSRAFSISGWYHTVWSIPAFGFNSSVLADVSRNQNH
jgi:hypothetical protein